MMMMMLLMLIWWRFIHDSFLSGHEGSLREGVTILTYEFVNEILQIDCLNETSTSFPGSSPTQKLETRLMKPLSMVLKPKPVHFFSLLTYHLKYFKH